MRPTSIPAEAVWSGGKRVVLAAPDGDLTNPDIQPLEVIVDQVQIGDQAVNRFNVRCALEPGDLEKLTAGGHVWVSLYGAMVPMCVDVTGPTSKERP
ncbi:hypothetical protein [Saccharothrix sp. HUAS TT1]|uniref:hypothetical protein n=1 Tax=unclassified Saccharothrix TaxID=2593673 RepID=UPI00345B692B